MSVRLIALDASSDTCSAALWQDGEVVTRSGDGRRAHSESLLPFVRDLLDAAGLSLRQLDAVAFGAGPGGFTGIRLVCGIAQGLAYGASLPVVAVGSLEALAWAGGEPRVYACVDARMGEVYCAAFERDGLALHTVLAPAVCAPGDAPLPPPGPWLGWGSGFGAHGPALAQRLGGCIVRVGADTPALAAAVAARAAHRFAAGELLAPTEAAPLYVRNRVALTTAERLARGGRA